MNVNTDGMAPPPPLAQPQQKDAAYRVYPWDAAHVSGAGAPAVPTGVAGQAQNVS